MNNHHINEINPYIIHSGYLNSSNCPPAGTIYGERTVKWYELELTLWGEGYIITEGKKLYTKKGGIFFRKPGMVVQGVSPYYCYIIIFDLIYDPDKVERYNEPEIMGDETPSEGFSNAAGKMSRIDGFNLPHLMNTKQLNRFKDLFEIIYHEYIRHGNENQFLLKTHLMQILFMMKTEWSSSGILQDSGRSINSNFPKVIKAREFMDAHISSRITLLEIAEAAGLSPNFLCRIFKKITGQSPITYLNTGKVNLAKKLLNETNMTVREISYECGFENDSYFYSLFGKLEGMTPSIYRQKQRSGIFL